MLSSSIEVWQNNRYKISYLIRYVLDFAKAWDICLKLKEKGLLCKQTRDDIIRFTPPLVINEEQILESTDIIIKIINGLK